MEEEKSCPEGAPEWLVTFGDMMSLLLTFFILLLSFANLDAVKFKQAAGSIKQALGVPQPETMSVINKGKDIITIEFNVEYNDYNQIKKLKREVDPLSNSKKNGLVDIEIFKSYRGVTVLMPARGLFKPGTDQLQKEALPLLDYLAGEAASHPAHFVVEASSPEDSPRELRFQDEWDLTTAQAVAAARYIRSSAEMKPGEVEPVGRGTAPPPSPPDRPLQFTEPMVHFLFLTPEQKPGVGAPE